MSHNREVVGLAPDGRVSDPSSASGHDTVLPKASPMEPEQWQGFVDEDTWENTIYTESLA